MLCSIQRERKTVGRPCAIGAEGVEAEITNDLTLPGLFHPTVKYTLATARGRERLAADAKRAGQRITAFCMENRFEEQPEMEIRRCGEAARGPSIGRPGDPHQRRAGKTRAVRVS